MLSIFWGSHIVPLSEILVEDDSHGFLKPLDYGSTGFIPLIKDSGLDFQAGFRDRFLYQFFDGLMVL